MSYFLPKLESGWHVDQAILAEDDRVVIIRFGHDWVGYSGINACVCSSAVTPPLCARDVLSSAIKSQTSSIRVRVLH